MILFFIFCLAAITILSYMQITQTVTGLEKFARPISSRQLSQRFIKSIRLMGISYENEDWHTYNSSLHVLKADYNTWVMTVLPAYTYGPATYTMLRLDVWDGSEYRIQTVTGAEAAQIVLEVVQEIIEDEATLFTNKTAAYLSPHVRFMETS
jgi:hypothetical protein